MRAVLTAGAVSDACYDVMLRQECENFCNHCRTQVVPTWRHACWECEAFADGRRLTHCNFVLDGMYLRRLIGESLATWPGRDSTSSQCDVLNNRMEHCCSVRYDLLMVTASIWLFSWMCGKSIVGGATTGTFVGIHGVPF